MLVDKFRFEKALIPDTRNPNIESEADKRKSRISQHKNTTVLTPRQKKNSINVLELTEPFLKKVNFHHEKQKQISRESKHAFNMWIQENKTKLEAIQEGKRLSAYFNNDQEIVDFV
jgi:phosphatidate phosphatase PAH1